MRIAFFVQQFPVLSETFILNQVTGLLDRGHQVTVFSYRRPPRQPVHPVVRDYRLDERVVYLAERDTVTGLGVRDLRALVRVGSIIPRGLGQLRRHRAAAFGGRLVLLRILERLASAGPRFDVIHCHFGDVALRSLFAAPTLGAPLVASFYGFDCSRLPLERGEDLYQRLFATANRVTALSGHMAARLRELGCPPELVVEHHIGIDPERFPFRPREWEPGSRPARLLTVARLVEKKGVEYALRAVAAVATGHRESAPEGETADRMSGRGAGGSRYDLEYEIIGDGPLRGGLEGLATELGLADVVRFRGAADQAVVRRAMDRADLFLLPSVTAGNGDQEGTPTVLMEAGACGLPVLSTRHAGIPEVVPEGGSGLLVRERDAKALAEGLRRLLSAPGVWPEMGRRGRTHVEEHYNSVRLAADLEALYRGLGAPSS